MRLPLAFVLGFTFVGMLTQAGCIPKVYAQFHGETKVIERCTADQKHPTLLRCQKAKEYVPVPTPPKAAVKPPTWKDTAKQIGRSGVVMIGVNVILTTFRFGMAAIGLPVF